MESTLRLGGEHLPELLSLVLAGPGHSRAPASKVAAFRSYLLAAGIEWEGWAVRRGDAAAGALALLPAGGTAILIFGPLSAAAPEDLSKVLEAALDELRRRDLYYVQAVVEPDEPMATRVLSGGGFQPLATLRYLERSIPRQTGGGQPLSVDWVAYSDATQSAFAQTIQRTYVDSLDCPRLSGLRPVGAILEGHRSSGPFDPSLWQLARLDGADAGCMLMSRVPDSPALEIVYMGVAPEFRRRGLGAALLERAMEQARRVRARCVTLVVDESNAPARRLYAGFGFRSTSRRQAWLFRGSSGVA